MVSIKLSKAKEKVYSFPVLMKYKHTATPLIVLFISNDRGIDILSSDSLVDIGREHSYSIDNFELYDGVIELSNK